MTTPFDPNAIPLSIVPFLTGDLGLSKELEENLKRWVDGDAPFLIMSGPNGTGKTTIACRMLNNWKRRHPTSTARYIKVPMLYHLWLDEVRSGSVMGLLAKYAEADFLILDELGVRFPSPGWHEWLFTLIDYRLDWKQRTIITTNKSASELNKDFGEAIMSRILVGTQIRIEGKDRRHQDTN